MNEQINKFEELRKKELKPINLLYVIGISLLVIAFFLMFVFLELEGLGAIFFVVGLILTIVAIIKQNNLKKRFKYEVVASVVKEVFPNSVYNPKVGLDLSDLMEPGVLRHPDKFYTEDLLMAEYDGIPFKMSEFTFQERHVTYSNGKRHVSYQTYAKGRHIIIDFKREFNEVIKVLESSFLGAHLLGLEKVETESIEFNKKFKCYSSNALTTFYILTPQIQEKLLELEKKFAGSIFFAFLKGKMHIVINDSANTLELKVRKVIDENTINRLKMQISIPIAIINDLKLNSDKFNRGDAI